jgi:hypothetical protein
MVLRLTGDDNELAFEDVEDDEEGAELAKPKANGSNRSRKRYLPVDNMGGR